VLAILCLYSAFFEYLSLGSKLRFLSSCSGNTGFSNSYSAADNDLVVFGIIIGVGLAALVLSLASPGKWYVGWWIGWAMLGPVAGLSVAFTMMFLKGGDHHCVLWHPWETGCHLDKVARSGMYKCLTLNSVYLLLTLPRPYDTDSR
jgi:hypothetical protein